MKKKKKIIILISILLIIILMTGLYIFQFDQYTGVITRIEKDSINIELPYEMHYSFSAKDVPIKNSSGKEINFSDLEVGDTIDIVNKKQNSKDDLIFSWEEHSLHYLYDIKVIKIIENK